MDTAAIVSKKVTKGFLGEIIFWSVIVLALMGCSIFSWKSDKLLALFLGLIACGILYQFVDAFIKDATKKHVLMKLPWNIWFAWVISSDIAGRLGTSTYTDLLWIAMTAMFATIDHITMNQRRIIELLEKKVS